MIGSMQETQEMLDYCAEKNIVADVELIPVQQINEAYERMLKNDVKYRFVLDMKTLWSKMQQSKAFLRERFFMQYCK